MPWFPCSKVVKFSMSSGFCESPVFWHPHLQNLFKQLRGQRALGKVWLVAEFFLAMGPEKQDNAKENEWISDSCKWPWSASILSKWSRLHVNYTKMDWCYVLAAKWGKSWKCSLRTIRQLRVVPTSVVHGGLSSEKQTELQSLPILNHSTEIWSAWHNSISWWSPNSFLVGSSFVICFVSQNAISTWSSNMKLLHTSSRRDLMLQCLQALRRQMSQRMR